MRGGNDSSVPLTGGSSPRHQWQLHSFHDLPGNVNVDAALYHVGDLYAVGGQSGQNIPAYTRFDLRLGWKPRRDLELSLAGQNLTDNRHSEFGGSPAQLSSEVPRSFYGKITWRF